MRKKYGKTLQEPAEYRIVQVVMNKKQITGFLILPVMVAGALLFASSEPAYAANCGGTPTAIISCDADNSGNNVENNGIWALLLIALNIMTAGVGILAVGGIVYGAILYTTAEDKADQVNKAIGIIQNVVIGLVMFALMYALLNFLIPGGIFS